MTRFLVFFFFIFLLSPDLHANRGNISPIAKTGDLANLPSFQSIQDKQHNKTIIWEIESSSVHKNSQFFLQKIDKTGELIWPQTVELTCGEKRVQSSHKLIEDGLGGVIITWEEHLEGEDQTTIYAQRISQSGQKLWGKAGILITSASGSEITPNLASDTNGGAIIAWSDSRNDPGFRNWDIYAQRISSTGKILWSENGIVVSDDLKDEFVGKVIANQDGGATVIWNMVVQNDLQEGEGYDFFSKKLNAKGEPVTNLNSASFISLPVSDKKYQLGSDIINDGEDGFLFTLLSQDDSCNSLYVQHVLSGGEAVFQGELGKLVDDQINDLQSLICQTDSLGTLLVGWSEKEKERILSYSQTIEPSYLSLKDTVENTLAMVDLESQPQSFDDIRLTDTTLISSRLNTDSSSIDSIQQTVLAATSAPNEVQAEPVLHSTDSITLREDIPKVVSDSSTPQPSFLTVTKMDYNTAIPQTTTWIESSKDSIGLGISSTASGKRNTFSNINQMLAKPQITISVKPGPYLEKLPLNQTALLRQ